MIRLESLLHLVSGHKPSGHSLKHKRKIEPKANFLDNKKEIDHQNTMFLSIRCMLEYKKCNSPKKLNIKISETFELGKVKPNPNVSENRILLHLTQMLLRF